MTRLFYHRRFQRLLFHLKQSVASGHGVRDSAFRCGSAELPYVCLEHILKTFYTCDDGETVAQLIRGRN